MNKLTRKEMYVYVYVYEYPTWENFCRLLLTGCLIRCDFVPLYYYGCQKETYTYTELLHYFRRKREKKLPKPPNQSQSPHFTWRIGLGVWEILIFSFLYIPVRFGIVLRQGGLQLWPMAVHRSDIYQQADIDISPSHSTLTPIFPYFTPLPQSLKNTT